MNKHGGKRPGSGRKKLFKETKIISFRVEADHVERIKELVEQYRRSVIASESLPQKKASESLPDKKQID